MVGNQRAFKILIKLLEALPETDKVEQMLF